MSNVSLLDSRHSCLPPTAAGTATTFSVPESDLWSRRVSSLLWVCEPAELLPDWLLSQSRKELEVKKTGQWGAGLREERQRRISEK